MRPAVGMPALAMTNLPTDNEFDFQYFDLSDESEASSGN